MSSPENDAAVPYSEDVRQLRHDLRTPVNHIVGYAELILEEIGEEEREKFLEEMKREIEMKYPFKDDIGINYTQIIKYFFRII